VSGVDPEGWPNAAAAGAGVTAADRGFVRSAHPVRSRRCPAGAEGAVAILGRFGAETIYSVPDTALLDHLVAPKAEALAQLVVNCTDMLTGVGFVWAGAFAADISQCKGK